MLSQNPMRIHSQLTLGATYCDTLFTTHLGKEPRSKADLPVINMSHALSSIMVTDILLLRRESAQQMTCVNYVL